MAAPPPLEVETPSDDELVARCLVGKQQVSRAFDELYARHAEPVLRFLHGFHRGDEHAARDALQETFVRFYKALGSFERGRPLRPWLYRIARNVSLDLWKRERRQPRTQEDPPEAAVAGPGPAEAVAGDELAGLLRQAIHRLPTEERAVFLLRFEQGHTFDEVADALSCSVRTAKYRHRAALERIGREAERLGVPVGAGLRPEERRS